MQFIFKHGKTKRNLFGSGKVHESIPELQNGINKSASSLESAVYSSWPVSRCNTTFILTKTSPTHLSVSSKLTNGRPLYQVLTF